MTNTSVKFCSLLINHHRIILSSHYHFLRTSTGAIVGFQALYFFESDPVGFEAGRHAEGPDFLQACCKYNFYHIAAH